MRLLSQQPDWNGAGFTLTLFLVSFRLNIKLRYLFLYLLSVSLYMWKSSLSVFLATSDAFSTDTFKSDSFSLRRGRLLLMVSQRGDVKTLRCRATHLCVRISFSESRTLLLIESTDTGFFEVEGDSLFFFSGLK